MQSINSPPTASCPGTLKSKEGPAGGNIGGVTRISRVLCCNGAERSKGRKGIFLVLLERLIKSCICMYVYRICKQAMSIRSRVAGGCNCGTWNSSPSKILPVWSAP